MKMFLWLLLPCLSYASSPHEFLLKTTSHKVQKKISTDCRAHIKEAMCLVTKWEEGQDPLDRQCLSGGESYAHYFETLHDQFPAPLQKVFCTLQRIFVEQEFFGSAFAGQIKNAQGEVLGSIMGIRQSLLDEKMTLERWAGWKEQLSFGGEPSRYETRPHLPLVQTKNARSSVNDFLFFVVAHEFGHIFDFANNLNATENCDNTHPEDPECDLAKGSFGAISWESTHRPLAENHFYRWEDFCFYSCQTYVPVAEAAAVYHSFWPSTFVSLYASREPWNDFADTLGYHLLFQKLAASYSIHVGKAVWDIQEKYASLSMKEKREYVEKFLNRSDIIYPGL